jgi:hypothetical protein
MSCNQVSQHCSSCQGQRSCMHALRKIMARAHYIRLVLKHHALTNRSSLAQHMIVNLLVCHVHEWCRLSTKTAVAAASTAPGSFGLGPFATAVRSAVRLPQPLPPPLLPCDARAPAKKARNARWLISTHFPGTVCTLICLDKPQLHTHCVSLTISL